MSESIVSPSNIGEACEYLSIFGFFLGPFSPEMAKRSGKIITGLCHCIQRAPMWNICMATQLATHAAVTFEHRTRPFMSRLPQLLAQRLYTDGTCRKIPYWSLRLSRKSRLDF